MSTSKYSLRDFDYHLPNELIAKYPASPRDSSRLMVIDGKKKCITHDRFFHLDRFVPSSSLLVLNNTKVFRARFRAIRKKDEKAFDFLLLSPQKDIPEAWNVLVSPLKKLRTGDVFQTKYFSFTFVKRMDDEGIIAFEKSTDPYHLMKKEGCPPLPPYIERDTTKKDSRTYQTVYARHEGSCAAPTAGLHFTNRIFDKLSSHKKCKTASVTLHVGRGTFSPIRTDKIENHPMHSEWYSVKKETCRILNRHHTKNRPIIAVGTTSVRTLETIYDPKKKTYRPLTGETSLFIYPPQKVLSCNHMITNFHLPKSSLLMLVCAFGGYDLLMSAYREAVQEKYRFYSYGDAMLILR